MKNESKKILNTDGLIIGSKALAELFGITTKRINQLCEEGVLEKVKVGSFDLKKTVNMYIEHLRSKSGGSEGAKTVNAEKEKEELLLKRAKRTMAELELARMQGNMHAAIDVEREYGNMVANFKQRILGIPKKVAPRMVTETNIAVIEEILEEEVYQALNELCEYDPSIFHDEKTIVVDDDD